MVELPYFTANPAELQRPYRGKLSHRDAFAAGRAVIAEPWEHAVLRWSVGSARLFAVALTQVAAANRVS